MIVSGYARDLNLFYPIYNFIAKSFNSNRFIVFLISCVTGVLPIPGRVTVSAGVLNTIAPKEKEKRKVYGIIDYLSTHHYYLWSPIEKSVIIPMAVLGISYWQFMYHMIPLLIITFVVILYYIFYVLKEDDVEISRTFSRHVIHPHMDISGETAEVQAIANAAWTDDVKAAWLEYKKSIGI